MQKNSNKGFTLIELVIVIAILAILGTAVFLNLRPGELLGDSRNSTRKSDLAALTTAISKGVATGDIVLVAQNQGAYDINSTSVSGSATAFLNNGTGYIKFTTQPNSRFELSKLPADPQNGGTYTCVNQDGKTDCATTAANGSTYKIVYCSNGTDFELNTYLEGAPQEMLNDGGDDAAAYETGTSLTLCPANAF